MTLLTVEGIIKEQWNDYCIEQPSVSFSSHGRNINVCIFSDEDASLLIYKGIKSKIFSRILNQIFFRIDLASILYIASRIFQGQTE